MKWCALLLGSSLLVTVACDVTSPDASRADVVGDDAVVDGAFVAVPAAPRLAASGWLELDSSPIVPWCGAVLVAPDVAVTTASCVEAWNAGFLRVGFGEVGKARSIAIDEVVLQKDAAEPGHALAALRLAEPVVGIDPVELGASQLIGEACGIESISYMYVLAGDESERWTWRGCVSADDASWLAATDGAPNCHGDLGAGAFRAGGTLHGVVVDAWADGACVRHERLATVADNEAFFEAALDLSQP